MVKGVPSQVAFEATDAYGNPITLFGRIINRRKEEIGHFATIHEGRGVFTYIPTGEDADKAEVELGGRSIVLTCRRSVRKGMYCTLIILPRKIV